MRGQEGLDSFAEAENREGWNFRIKKKVNLVRAANSRSVIAKITPKADERNTEDGFCLYNMLWIEYL